MGTSQSLHAITETARRAARRILRRPSLYSVGVCLEQATPDTEPVRYRVGFQALHPRLFGGVTVKVCWVDVCVDPPSAAISSSGTFGRKQFGELASVPGIEFPPPALTLDGLKQEPADVLQQLKMRPLLGVTASLGNIDLTLCWREGHLAWRVLQEVRGVAFRTLFLDAKDGRILFQKIDREHGSSSDLG